MLRFKSILIIDNDPIYIFLTKKQIQKANIAAEVYTARNGEKAIDFIIQYFKEFRTLPEVILTDLRMPVMNGIEFIRKLNKLPFYKSDQVILASVTSSQNYQELETIKNEGINYLFPKPLLKEYIRFLKLIKIRKMKPELYERILKMRNTALLN